MAQQPMLQSVRRERATPIWLKIGFWACTVIAVAAVIRRLLALAHPPAAAPPRLAAMDAVFASHAALTLAHILPALAFVLLAPFVVLRRTPAAWARILYPLGVVVGGTAYAMSGHAIGGWIERSAVLVFNSYFLFSLAKAYQYSRRSQPSLEREWITRAIVVLLGIATTRPVMGAFFATSALTHLRPDQFFGIAFWIGFSINAIVVELWLYSRHRRFDTPLATKVREA